MLCGCSFPAFDSKSWLKNHLNLLLKSSKTFEPFSSRKNLFHPYNISIHINITYMVFVKIDMENIAKVDHSESKLSGEEERKEKKAHKMEYSKQIGGVKVESVIMRWVKTDKLKSLIIAQLRLSRLKLWALGATTMLLLCTFLVQLGTLNEAITAQVLMFRSSLQQIALPAERVYESNGYLMLSTNGGLNQMRAGICDMVAVAAFLNVTLIVPELDNTSFWNDKSQFQDIFDVDHFITSLRDQVRILKELPEDHKSANLMAPVSWSNISFYYDVVLPRIRKYKVVRLSKTDTRLSNNGNPLEVQQLRCRVNYKALKFTSPIEEMGKKIVRLLRQNGPFLVLHLRYEMDMLAFSGCNEGCNDKEVEELTKLRYAYPWWREKEINSYKKRKEGACPLTPEETALALRALDIDPNVQIYIAAGNIYGGEKRMTSLRLAFPHLVKKETLITDSDLKPFLSHSNQMAALDYFVALESDIFVPTYGGNMAKVVEGHRRYLGFKPTIRLNRMLLVNLIDRYRYGNLTWNEFTQAVKTGHANKWGGPTRRVEIPGKPKYEEYFYSNPQECLPSIAR